MVAGAQEAAERAFTGPLALQPRRVLGQLLKSPAAGAGDSQDASMSAERSYRAIWVAAGAGAALVGFWGPEIFRLTSVVEQV